MPGGGRRPAGFGKETDVSTAILRALQLRGAEARKLHIDQYAQAGDPDIYACLGGRMIHFETKARGAPGARRNQILKLWRWQRAGALVGSPRSVQQALDLLDGTVVWTPPPWVYGEPDEETALNTDGSAAGR